MIVLQTLMIIFYLVGIILTVGFFVKLIIMQYESQRELRYIKSKLYDCYDKKEDYEGEDYCGI